MDEKDRFILQLRQEIDFLQQNQRDYGDLNFLLTNVEHRYSLLNEEKIRIEQESTTRNEKSMQTIAMHRADIDQLREDLQYSQTQNNKMRTQLDDMMFHQDKQQQYSSQQNQNKAQIEYLLSQTQQLTKINNKLQDELLNEKEQYNNVQIQLEELSIEVQNQQDSQLNEKISLQKQIERLEEYKQRNEITNKNQENEIDQLKNKTTQQMVDVLRDSENQLKIQKEINNQLVINNEHFQLKIITLIQQNELLSDNLDDMKQQKQKQPKESDIKYQIQELQQEAFQLRKSLSESEQIIKELKNEKKSLQQQLESLEDSNQMNIRYQDETKNSSILKIIEQDRIINLQNHNMKRMERDLILQDQKIMELEKKFTERELRITCSNNQKDYEQVRDNFVALQKEYQVLIKINKAEVERVREAQFKIECKDKELNRTIKHIQDIEIEIRNTKNLASENKELKIQLEQQTLQVKRFFEEGHLIKEYLSIQQIYILCRAQKTTQRQQDNQ